MLPHDTGQPVGWLGQLDGVLLSSARSITRREYSRNVDPVSQRSRQKNRNKARRSAARAYSGVASMSPVETSDSVSMVSTSLPAPASTALSQSPPSAAHAGDLLPRDEQLFDRVLTQWQFGDWNRLATLDPEGFAHHPRRARLALLAAAGHQQLGHQDETRRLVHLAYEWGCDRTLIKRVLISGVYNTLGRVNALAGRQSHARERLETALAVGAPGQDLGLLMPVRLRQQFDDAGLPAPTAATPRALGQATDSKADRATLEAAKAAWMLGDWNTLTTFDKADLVQHPARAELARLIAAGYQQVGDMAAADRCTQLALAWGEDRRLMRATLTSGAFNLLGRACAASLRYGAAQANFARALQIMQVRDDVNHSRLKARIEHQVAMIPGLDVAETVAAILGAEPETAGGNAELAAS